MNRLDKIVVFQPLKHDGTGSGAGNRVGTVQKRVLDTAMGKFLFRVTPAGREFLLQEGTDQRYGARHLKRAIERYMVYPLANLLATQQVNVGDLVRIDWDGVHKELSFVRESQGALSAARAADEEVTAAATPGDEGLGKDAPAKRKQVPKSSCLRPCLPPARRWRENAAQNRKEERALSEIRQNLFGWSSGARCRQRPFLSWRK